MNELGYHQKGFSDVAGALLILDRCLEGKSRKMKYISVGNGAYEDEFINILNRLTNIEHIHFHSLPNNKVHEYLANSDIVIAPSRCEGQSMFALEAISEGKPIIFTIDNGMKDIAINNYNGLAISRFDSPAIADAVLRYYSDRNLVIRHGKNSLKLYEDNFSADRVSNMFSAMMTIISTTYNKGDNKKKYVSTSQILSKRRKDTIRHLSLLYTKRKFFFEELNRFRGQNIAVYGAGEVGRELYQEL